MVLMGVVLPMRQDERWIKIASHGLEVVLDVRDLGGEISIAEPKHLDPFLRHTLKNGGRAVPRLGPTLFIAAENDPSHNETGHLLSDTQNGSAAADLNVVGVGTQTKQPKRPWPVRWKN